MVKKLGFITLLLWMVVGCGGNNSPVATIQPKSEAPKGDGLMVPPAPPKWTPPAKGGTK